MTDLTTFFKKTGQFHPSNEFVQVCGASAKLSLKKELPQRTKSEKPILKFDTSLVRPAELHSQTEAAVYQQENRIHPSSSQNALKLNSSLCNSQASITEVSLHHQRVGSDAMTSQTSRTKSMSSPYNRPLSAKEASDDLQKQRKKFIVSSMANGLAISSASMSLLQNVPSNHGIGHDHYSGSSLQHNTFMRPQSGLRKVSTPNMTRPQKIHQGPKGAGDSASEHGNSPSPKQFTGEVNQKLNSMEQPQTVRSKKPVVPPVTFNKSTHIGKMVVGSSNKFNSTALGTRHSNFYTPTKPYTEANSTTYKDALSPGGSGKKQTSIVNSQPPVSSAASSGKILPLSLVMLMNMEGSVSKRTEAFKPHSNISASSVVSGKEKGHQQGDGYYSKGESQSVHVKSMITHVEGHLKESGLPVHNLRGDPVLRSQAETAWKIPVTNTPHGALCYKKNMQEPSMERKLKELQVTCEQRPGGDGAPSMNGNGSAEKKHLIKDDAEDEQEEEEVSTPSGERSPGDGEASCDELNQDDDGVDDLDGDGHDDEEEEEDCGEEEDVYSDDYTIHDINSSLSQASSCPVLVKSATRRPSTAQSIASHALDCPRPHSALGEPCVQPALRASLFPDIPPTIHFVGEGEKVELLPWQIRKLLKWRMSPVTPNVVKAAIARSHFRISRKNHDWIGCFGKHMKSNGFRSIREYQKINHFPGSFQLGRKDRLWRNLLRMQLHFGKSEFSFFPKSFVLPSDFISLKHAFEDGSSRQKWIVKPPASARGIGIKVINKWSQLPRRRAVIVQKYLAKPLLINGSKFDMRVYVYVTCYDPLRAYVYEDGLARFASCKYSQSAKSLNNKFMHLTNYSVNKHNACYQSNADNTICQGHKWSLKSLWSYLKKQGVSTAAIWENIKDIVVKTLISAESPINSMTKCNVRSRYIVHELFGFDILLDENYKPWVLEVNISPSLHSNSQLDINVKGQMICDMLNLAGLRIPDKNDVQHGNHLNSTSIDFSAHMPPNGFCIDKRLFTSQLAPDERAKHAYFCTRYQDEQAQQTILDILTPDDVRILTESIDEDSRKGGFVRVFPTPSTKKYMQYFEQPRYYNLLLDQWVQRYNRIEQRGISLLQSLCEEGIHLESPTEGHKHQWTFPNYAVVVSTRDVRQPSASMHRAKDNSVQTKGSQFTSKLPQVRSGVALPSSFHGQTASGFSHMTSSNSSRSYLGYILQNSSQASFRPQCLDSCS